MTPQGFYRKGMVHMEQVVYIDVLFIVNLFVNYFLLLATNLCLKAQAGRGRILIGSLVGALYSLFIFYPQLNVLLSVISKLIFSLSLVLITFKVRSFALVLKSMAVFFAVNFAFAGAMFGIWLVLAPKGMVVNNGVVYFDISLLHLGLFTIGAYLIVSLVHRILKNWAPRESVIPLTICIDGRTACVDALVDTGNSLCETFSGLGVVVVEYMVVKPLLSPSLQGLFESVYSGGASDCADTRFRVIPFSAVGSLGILPALKPDYLEAGGQRISQCYLAACNQKLSDGQYLALIHANLFDSQERRKKDEIYT